MALLVKVFQRCSLCPIPAEFNMQHRLNSQEIQFAFDTSAAIYPLIFMHHLYTLIPAD
jgi:hypothetical protein